jgi:membrane protein
MAKPIAEVIRIVNKVRADGVTGHAAMIAYNFFLALPVAIIFIVSLLGIVPHVDVTGSLLDQLRGVAPQEVLDFVETTVDEALGRGQGLLIISFVGAIYVLSNAYAGLITSLNAVYELKEERPWLLVRLRALLLSFFATGLLIVAFILILVTPAAMDYLSAHAGLSSDTAQLLSRLRWPVVSVLALIAVESTYRYGPADGPRWRFISPGSVFSTLGWVTVTFVFGIYVNNFASYDRIYGTLTTVVVLLVWLWMSALTFLLGAEVNMLWRHWRGHGKRAQQTAATATTPATAAEAEAGLMDTVKMRAPDAGEKTGDDDGERREAGTG